MIRRREAIIWAAGIIYAALMLWPASFWYDAGDMFVGDHRAGEEMPLRYLGGVERGFKGSYTVVIRSAANGEVVAEDRSGTFEYSQHSARPDPLTIDWWAPRDSRMQNLSPGEYRMETCWTIHGAFWGLVPAKTTCTRSNLFRVLP